MVRQNITLYSGYHSYFSENMLFEVTCNWSRLGECDNTNLSQPQASLSGGYGPIKRFE